MLISNVFKNSNYGDSLFTAEEISAIEQRITIRAATEKTKETAYIACLVRNKDIKLTPEEVVRQLYTYRLLNTYGYTADRVKFEYEVTFGREKKRADVVIVDKDRPDTAYIIIEVKKPKQKDGKEQLKSYTNATGAPIAVWTNGQSIFTWNRRDPNYFEPISHIPRATEELSDVISERYTYADLKARDKIANERTSLRDLILDMEDEVLANAGVDAFEEVFKLILAKLYDEMVAANDECYYLRFRNGGETESKLKTKIEELFNAAKDKWDGIFSEDTRIALTPSLLSVCVSTLQDVKLFNNNLDVVDDAFEYLMSKTAKSEKGQYFTPRYVIDMCVRMMNPREGEDIIDTAAGSSGFTVHSIFKVWRDIRHELGLPVGEGFTTDKRTTRETDFVRDHVFAIDYDEKPVRVARTLNLIAGDGQTNVLYLNTLDYGRWVETTKEQDWIDKYNDGFKRLRKRNANGARSDDYSQFSFDLLMANPPFAGDVKEGTVLSKYELGKNAKGKMQSTVSRHVLFIERNLNFLKPGGRMAIVLPQGIFNNSTDKYIRDYIAERCRILAVVGLHGNVFKPHTGTKTSVLFLQKWNNDPAKGVLCPHREDYPIFFATMQKPSKDNSGDKIYVMDGERGEPKLDGHGHLIVDHDLYNHDGITEDGIAEAFIGFAKRERLSFFVQARPFDAERYAALMDGLEAVEVRLSELEFSRRIDSEYYKKSNLAVEKLSKQIGGKVLMSLGCKVDCSAFYPSVANDYDFNGCGIPFLRVDEIQSGLVRLKENTAYLSEEIIEQNSSTIAKAYPGDIIIAKGGNSLAKVGIVVDEYPVYGTCRDIIVLRTDKILGAKKHFLWAYLHCKYGQSLLLRSASQTGQPHLTMPGIRNLLFPDFSMLLQQNIEKLYNDAMIADKQSQSTYADAEAFLLSALGMDNFMPSQKPVAEKSFTESFGVSGRLDAEYYQPKYDDLEKAISTFNAISIKNLVNYPVSSGITPKAGGDDYTAKDLGVPFIRAIDIANNKVQLENCIYIKYRVHNDTLKRTQLKKNDVLFSIAGTAGRCGIFTNDVDANINQAVSILRFDENAVKRLYLVCYFNSFMGKLYISRYARQGLQTNLNLGEVSNLCVPIIDFNVQQKIASDVEKSFDLRRQSEQLLDAAKRAVEIAIEDGEDAALAWLHEQHKGVTRNG